MLNNKGFDLWADGYDADVDASDSDNTYPFAGYRSVLNRIYGIIRAGCGKRVLDIGFGTGVLAARLYADGFSITGIDFSGRMIGIAREKMPSARLIQHDFSQGLPEELEGEPYDAIVCTYALHHLTDGQKISFLKGLQTHLNPGGKILIGDISFENSAAREACRISSGDEWDDDEFYFAADEMCGVFRSAHYEKISHCAGVLTIAEDE